MKKLVSVVAMLTCAVWLCACGNSAEQVDSRESTIMQDVVSGETVEAVITETVTDTAEAEMAEAIESEVVETEAVKNTTLGLYNMVYAIAEFNLPEDFAGIDWPYVDAAEVDYTYMFGDEETEEFYGYICFEIPNFTVKNASERLNSWHGITDAVLEEIDHEVFDYHLIGENESRYYEAYVISEEHPEEGISIWHGVTLDLDAMVAEKEKIVQDYHAIIDSMSIRYCTEDECLEVIYGE